MHSNPAAAGLIIHSAISKVLKEKHPDPSNKYKALTGFVKRSLRTGGDKPRPMGYSETWDRGLSHER